MKHYLTKTQADKWLKEHPKAKFSGRIRIDYDCFLYSTPQEFKEDMPVPVIFVWYGGFTVNSGKLPKEICPCCGQKSLVPYHFAGSVLLGCHIIKFHCLNCKELVACDNNTQYYQQVRDYCFSHKKDLQPYKNQPYMNVKGKKFRLKTLPEDTAEQTEEKGKENV